MHKHVKVHVKRIESELNGLKMCNVLFADDCVLYRNIKTVTDCQILQNDLNSLGQWETDGK